MTTYMSNNETELWRENMRCRICNTNLSTGESLIKDKHTGEFLDQCGKCSSDIYATLKEFDYEIKINSIEWS